MIALVIVWGVAIVCIPIMRKIQPDAWIAYAVWALLVAGLFTAFLYCYRV